jgi:hypothetical protein
MMVTTPIPTVPAPKPSAPAPAPATGTPAAPTPAGGAAPATTPAPSGQAADGAAQGKPAPSGDAAPADAAAAAKQAVFEKLEKTTATDAITQVGSHLDKISSLSIGGGTPEGAESAKVATALLTDASMLIQHAHVKSMEQLRTMATELHVKLMSSASGLAFMGGQVAIAGQSKEAIKLADIAAGPITETKQTIAEVMTALAPKDAAPAAAAGTAPATPAPNGNTGIVPPAAANAAPVADPTKTPPTASGPVPTGLQHVTPGPGAGRGPNPA